MSRVGILYTRPALRLDRERNREGERGCEKEGVEGGCTGSASLRAINSHKQIFLGTRNVLVVLVQLKSY